MAGLWQEPIARVLRRQGEVAGTGTLIETSKRMAFAQPTKNLWIGCPELVRPYRGLRDFDEDDEPFFFGRSAFVDQLRTKLQSLPIVGVTAASGSGKSSVIKAGLIPRLRREGDWCIISLRPSHDREARLPSRPAAQQLEIVSESRRSPSPWGSRLMQEL